MKFIRSSVLCLLAIHAAAAFKDLFKPHTDSKSGGILDILTKPKIPGLNINLGSHFGTGASFGTGSFGFGFGFGGQFLPSGTGEKLPPKETVHVKPDFHEGSWEEGKKKKVGPRPNSGEDEDSPKPGSYEDEGEDYPKPVSFEDNKEYPKPSYKEKDDSLPDWEDIGEKNPKYENMMDGVGLIQPRLNRRRSKRFIESRVFHVPLLFRSNAKPYRVKIQSNPNSLMKAHSEE